MRRLWCWLIVLVFSAAGGLLGGADDPAAGTVIVTDVDGNEHTLSGVKYGAGTKRLAWLADPKDSTEDAKRGPVALEVRELTSAMPLAQGIVTLVLMTSVESIRYDLDKEQVAIGVKGLSQPLTGALFYPRVNAIGLSGTSSTNTSSFTGGVRGKPSVKSMAARHFIGYARTCSGSAAWLSIWRSTTRKCSATAPCR